MTAHEPGPSSGVDSLIARLRQDGVEAGRHEGDKILGEAKAEAARILEKANQEARDRLAAAQKEADSYLAAGKQALKTAIRDAVLDMKGQLAERFNTSTQRLVSHYLQDEAVLRQLILEVAGRAADGADIDDDEIEVILPETAIGLEELRGDPDELQHGTLTAVVLGITGAMMREGVSFRLTDEVEAGIRVRAINNDVTIDLTDEAVANILLRHLQPRFRAILEGIVK